MQRLTQKRWITLFFSIALLVLCQVAWWTAVFLQDVTALAQLKRESVIAAKLAPAALEVRFNEISHEAFHRRVMFLSESVTFALLICLALYLLYHALNAERRSREIQRNFIEVVTHESRTPLTALKLRLESLSSKCTTPELLADLQLARDEVRRLSSTFEKAMSLNRLERRSFTFEDLLLRDVVEEVVHRLEPFFRAKQVSLKLDLVSDAQVRGDSFGLQNSVLSLLENAVLYNPSPEKTVEIKVHGEGARAKIAIHDNGFSGIAGNDGMEPQIFERFYRAKSGARVAGTGLGLYLARAIVEAHQGSLRLTESGAKGSVFEIDLPLVDAG